MSAADGVTRGSDAQRPDHVGATGASAIDTERAQHAQPFTEANRDRSPSDADEIRSRDVFENERSDATDATAAEALDDEESLAIRRRCLATIVAARRALKGFKQPSNETREGYARKADHLFKVVSLSRHDEITAWMKALTPYAQKSNSFYAMRAAACWRARELLRELLSRQCATQRFHGMSNQWLAQVEETERTLETLNVVEDVERQELLEMAGLSSEPVTSKRQTLKHLPDDWRRQVVDRAQSTGTYGDEVSALELTGCRPIELAWGVCVSLDFPHAVIRIRGAKATDMAGQAWRELDVDYRALAPSLLGAARRHEEVWVGKGSTAGLRKAVRKLGKALWPKGPALCPYHFRHALAEDLREAGWTAEEIGAALGHRVSETSAAYGRKRRQGQGRGGVSPVTIIRGGVRTAVAVRPLRPFNLASIAPRAVGSSASGGLKSAKKASVKRPGGVTDQPRKR